MDNSDDFVYFDTNVLLNYLTITDPSQDHYESLYHLLIDLRRRCLFSADEVAIEVGRTPFARLAKILPKDRVELYAFIAIVISILQLIITLQSTSTNSVTREQMEEVIARVLDHKDSQTPPVVIITLSECRQG